MEKSRTFAGHGGKPLTLARTRSPKLNGFLSSFKFAPFLRPGAMAEVKTQIQSRFLAITQRSDGSDQTMRENEMARVEESNGQERSSERFQDQGSAFLQRRWKGEDCGGAGEMQIAVFVEGKRGWMWTVAFVFNCEQGGRAICTCTCGSKYMMDLPFGEGEGMEMDRVRLTLDELTLGCEQIRFQTNQLFSILKPFIKFSFNV